MFLFNRSPSSSPHTRKNSRDSVQISRPSSRQATPSPSLSTSTGEWSPQRRRGNTDGAKRTSVFGGHQRSKTITSSVYLNSAAASTVSVDTHSWRGFRKAPLTLESVIPRSERSESMAKSLLSRSSRLLKRQNSTLTSLRTLDGVDVPDRGRDVYEVQELSGCSQLHHDGTQSIDDDPTKKRNISEPYNFQHLTHAHAKQLPELERASHNELVTEFSAIRASQAPRRELRGIKAENLHFKNFSSEALLQDLSTSSPIDPITPPPLSPTRSTEFLRRDTPSPLHSVKSPHYARSVENFSLPGPRSPRSPPSPMVPPPRTSSRAALTMAFASPRARLESPTSPVFGRPLAGSTTFSSINDEPAMFLSLQGAHASTDGSGDFPILPHAVTTSDDSALHLLPLPFGTPGTELPDVPEEDESYFRKRSSVRSSRPSTASSALRHAQSFPCTKTSSDRPTSNQSLRGFSEAQGQQRPLSNASNPLTPPFGATIAANRFRPSVSSERMSRSLKGIEGGWEDDIDYCYEHAAEADCDFDWDRISRDDVEDEGTPDRLDDGQHGTENLSSGKDYTQTKRCRPDSTTKNFPPESLRLVSVDSTDIPVPDLEPASALSESTSGPEALTPSLSLLPPPPIKVPVKASKGSEGFLISPSLLTPPDYEAQMLEEAMYQEMLSNSVNSDRHYPFYNRVEEGSESRTDSPLSKCNSLESMVVSRTASVMQNHRSSNSSGSLPELVHSKNSQERFDMVADELAEHIASLNTVEATVDTQRSISPPYKRRTSLAKEVAHQSMLKKVTSNASAEDAEAPAPVVQSTRQRDRLRSEEGVKVTSATSAHASGPPIAKRSRSSSTATTTSSRPSSRVSYTLFPTSTIRSIS
ncbi:MAG: hypothetical protein M1830_010848 [Pleopsidium flavum]|nr:MAG: hypothetical protein M1830_010848 [Pleopsidium flavum]